ncbi:MAG: glycosyltransferase family 2 protein [Candidatus Pacearchaeota archaeon]
MYKLAVIVLNWNGWEDTIGCLESIQKGRVKDCRIWVLDNGSNDESVKKIGAWNVDRKVHFLKSNKNLGFTGGNNFLFRKILKEKNKPKYISIINNDTIVKKDTFKRLIKVLDSNKKIGVVSPAVFNYYDVKKLSLEDNPGKFNLKKGGGEKWPNSKNLLKGGKIFFVDYTGGSCWVLRRETFEKAGLFNEKFFAYGEEIDLAIRINKCGYKFAVDPTTRMWHKVAASSKKISGFRIFYSTRNMIWLERIHASSVEFLFFLFNMVFIKFPKNIYEIMKQGKRFLCLKEYFRGIFIGLFTKRENFDSRKYWKI